MRPPRRAYHGVMHSPRASLLSLVFIVAMSCGQSESTDSGSNDSGRSSQPQKRAPSCAERTAALHASLTTEVPPGNAFHTTEPIPRIAGGRHFAADDSRAILVVARTDDAIEVQGIAVGVDRAERLIQAVLESSGSQAAGQPIYVAASAELPVASLQRAIEKMPARVALRLVVVDAAAPPDPYAAMEVPPGAAAWTKAWLEKMPRVAAKPIAAREHLAEGLRRSAAASCPQIGQALAAVGDAMPADRRAVLADGVTAAIHECGCARVDPAVDLVIRVAHHVPDLHLRWLELPRRLPTASTVGDLARALAAR
jgi:hypothetical protein